MKNKKTTLADQTEEERIGYARVSTLDQDPNHQIEILRRSGCKQIFVDYASGSIRSRPELDKAMANLKEGSTLVVWKFDRLGRSLKHLIEFVNILNERNVQLQSLTENIDTSTPGGRMIFSIMGALAEFERSLISERTCLAAAQRGKDTKWGRPSKFHDQEFVDRAKALLARPDLSRVEVARRLGVKPVTLYKWFRGGRPENFLRPQNKDKPAS